MRNAINPFRLERWQWILLVVLVGSLRVATELSDLASWQRSAIVGGAGVIVLVARLAWLQRGILRSRRLWNATAALVAVTSIIVLVMHFA